MVVIDAHLSVLQKKHWHNGTSVKSSECMKSIISLWENDVVHDLICSLEKVSAALCSTSKWLTCGWLSPHCASYSWQSLRSSSAIAPTLRFSASCALRLPCGTCWNMSWLIAVFIDCQVQKYIFLFIQPNKASFFCSSFLFVMLWGKQMQMVLIKISAFLRCFQEIVLFLQRCSAKWWQRKRIN